MIHRTPQTPLPSMQVIAFTIAAMSLALPASANAGAGDPTPQPPTSTV